MLTTTCPSCGQATTAELTDLPSPLRIGPVCPALPFMLALQEPAAAEADAALREEALVSLLVKACTANGPAAAERTAGPSRLAIEMARIHLAYAAFLMRPHAAAAPHAPDTVALAHVNAAMSLSRDLAIADLLPVAERLRDQLALPPRTTQPMSPDGLTVRETEVLVLLARGKTTHEIAGILVLSSYTVTRHITNIYTKINVRNRAGATAYALAHKLL